MPETIRYPLYDTAIFGVAAGAEQVLFSVAQGSDATHTKDFTNSRGAGSLPQGEKFVVDNVHVFLDESSFTESDYLNVWRQSYLEIRVNDQTQFIVPLRMVASHNEFGGHFTQAAAADEGYIGLVGSGYELDTPIDVEGGASFKVIVKQGTALSAASQQVKVVLDGLLTRA